MNQIKILPQRQLNGTVEIPSSKSLSHRAIICAALSDGLSRLQNITFSRDIDATCRVLKNLGAKIHQKDSVLTVEGTSNLKISDSNLFCDESGSTLRFLIPIALLQDKPVIFNGAGRLKERPLTPFYDIFQMQGIYYSSENDNLPLTVSGKLRPGTFHIKGNVSSQFISGLMFALPLLEGKSKIVVEGILESKPYVDLTISSLHNYGICINNDNYTCFEIEGNQKYTPLDYTVEGDFSQAAFFITAAALNGNINCTNLLPDSSLQGDKKIIDIIKSMGGKIDVEKDFVLTKTSNLHSTDIDASQIPDLVPILTVAAALSEGTTTIYNASRLRIKECDRLKAISTELNKLGADILEKEDSLIIKGKEYLQGGIVDSWNDHRIVMSLAVAALKCKEPVIINDYTAVNKSYPNFFNDFNSLGGVAEIILDK